MRLLTVRSVVVILVALMGFILIMPTALQYFKQRAANDALRDQLGQIKADNENSENEYNRWQDDKFVIAQARERLTFVFPGETPYRVIDPESVTETEDAATGDGTTAGAAPGQPWYSTVWQSVEIAGTTD